MEKEETISRKECEKIGLLKMLAAFVDGEGTINIGMRKFPSGDSYYQQRLSVGNTNIRLIEWLIENFGGSFPKATNRGENRKDMYLWELSGSNSYKLIKKIRPYLILKQEQADCAIELYEKVSKWNYNSSKPLPEHKKKLAKELYQRNKVLNKNGKDNEEIEVPVTIKIRKDVLDEWIKKE